MHRPADLVQHDVVQLDVRHVAGDVCDADLPVVNGTDHSPWFGGTTFSMRHLATDYPFITLHCWPYFTGCMEYGTVDDPPSLNLAAFMAQFVRAWTAEPGSKKPVWLQEFGCCDLWAESDRQERYLRHTVASAVASGVTHLTFWCSHDKTDAVRFCKDEYHFGLIDTANKLKPLGQAYREIIRQCRNDVVPPFQPACDCIMSIPDDFVPRYRKATPPATWIEQQASSTLWDIYRTYLRLLAEGRSPKLRLSHGDDIEIASTE